MIDFSHLKINVLWAFAGIFTVLAIASSITFLKRIRHRDIDYKNLSQRVNSWWVMIAIFALAVGVSKNATIILFGILSFLALKEYLSLIPTRRADRRVLFWVYLTIPVQYIWVAKEWYGMYIIFIPVYVFLLLPMRMVLIGETKDFLRAIGTIHWGLMMTVFSVSHVALLMALPESGNSVGGGAGLVLFLVFLTQFNDVSQYVWGKLFGSHKVIPKVSPNKTWEGFIGGVLTTILVSWLIAEYLTPFSWRQSLEVGAIIGIGGFIGDVTISALKRDLGVKDSSQLIPGHGGILDRLDSLIYTAPLFFHYTYYFNYPHLSGL